MREKQADNERKYRDTMEYLEGERERERSGVRGIEKRIRGGRGSIATSVV